MATDLEKTKGYEVIENLKIKLLGEKGRICGQISNDFVTFVKAYRTSKNKQCRKLEVLKFFDFLGELTSYYILLTNSVCFVMNRLRGHFRPCCTIIASYSVPAS